MQERKPKREPLEWMLIVVTAAVAALIAFFLWALITHPHHVHAQAPPAPGSQLVGGEISAVRNEQPAGAPNGVLRIFTLKNKPLSVWSVSLYLNGIRQTPGLDYAVVPNTNQLGFLACCIPQPGDHLLADYDF